MPMDTMQFSFFSNEERERETIRGRETKLEKQLKTEIKEKFNLIYTHTHNQSNLI